MKLSEVTGVPSVNFPPLFSVTSNRLLSSFALTDSAASSTSDPSGLVATSPENSMPTTSDPLLSFVLPGTSGFDGSLMPKVMMSSFGADDWPPAPQPDNPMDSTAIPASIFNALPRMITSFHKLRQPQPPALAERRATRMGVP